MTTPDTEEEVKGILYFLPKVLRVMLQQLLTSK